MQPNEAFERYSIEHWRKIKHWTTPVQTRPRSCITHCRFPPSEGMGGPLYASTVHCTHIDNDKYMGIIKSWNLFLCAYNRGQLTHPFTPSHREQSPIMQAAPKRRISSKNTENAICLKVPKPGECVETTTITVTRQNTQTKPGEGSEGSTMTMTCTDLHRVQCIARNLSDKMSAANFRILPIFV